MIKVAIIGCGMRQDFVEPLRNTRFIQPVFYYNQTGGYLDFDVSEYSYIKKYKNLIDLFIKLIKFNPDFVFSNEPLFLKIFPINLITFIYCLIFKKKYSFAALENIDPVKKYGRLINSFFKVFYNIYISKASFIIPLNNSAEHLIKKYSNKEPTIKKMMYGVWGVNVDEFSPLINDLDPKLRKNSILFVGRLIDGKGIMYLLKAMKIVRKQVSDAKLYIIGQGPLKKEIVSKKEDYFEFLGSIENHLMPGYFRAAKITCIPSITTDKWSEQAGIANIQSISCGTPIVSTFSGSIPEYFPHNEVGILVEEKDSNELADAIIKLLTDQELNKRLGRNGRNLVIEKYNAEKNTNYFENFIFEYLNKETGNLL